MPAVLYIYTVEKIENKNINPSHVVILSCVVILAAYCFGLTYVVII